MEYDRFADIYGVWTATAPSALANHAFYVEAYCQAEGPVVELGVGDGRLAVDAALRGTPMVGVDLSPVMLALCRERAARAGVSERLALIEADFRSFIVPAPAGFIALPYHSLGHLRTLDEKRAALRHIHTQLRPGGVFVFDDFVMTPERIDRLRQVQLRAEYTATDGSARLLWVTSLVDETAQTMRVVTWEDRLGADGLLLDRRYRTLSLSWLQPPQARALLEEAGFSIEACYGDFDATPFDASTAQEQIWLSRKDPRS